VSREQRLSANGRKNILDSSTSGTIDKASNDKGENLNNKHNVTVILRQVRAAEVAKFALKQRFERIEFEEKHLKPLLERIALEAGSNLELPSYDIIEHSSDV